MNYLIIGITFGLCFFVLWAYRRGLKDGLAIQQGKPIEPIKNPVQVIQQYVEEKKADAEQDKATQGLMNLMVYNGDPQPEVK